MNARRTALVLLAALLILVGAGLLLARHGKQKAQDAAVSQPALPSSVLRIEIRHAQTDFTLIFENGLWTLAGDPDFPLDQNACRGLADRLRMLAPVRSVSDAQKAQVGLDEPACTVTAEDAQGERHVFTIGAKNERDALYYLGLDDAVYLIEPADAAAFFVTPYDLASDERPPILDAACVLSLSVRTHTGQWHYTLTSTQDGYTVQGTLLDAADPERIYPADPVQAMELYKACAALYLYDCVEYRALDDSALEAYGLRTPTARAALVYREKDDPEEHTRVWLFGARADGRIYAQLEGSNRIYTADASEAARFLAPDFEKLKIK